MYGQDDLNNRPSIDDLAREIRREMAADDLNNRPSLDDIAREIRRQANPTDHPLDLQDLIAERSTPEPIYPSWIETQPMYESIQWLTQPVEPIDDHYMPEPLPDPPPPPEPYFPQPEDWGLGHGPGPGW